MYSFNIRIACDVFAQIFKNLICYVAFKPCNNLKQKTVLG